MSTTLPLTGLPAGSLAGLPGTRVMRCALAFAAALLLVACPWPAACSGSAAAQGDTRASEPRPVLVDTDATGLDDAFLLSAACNSPDLDLLGVTISGRDPEAGARVVRRILWLAGRTDVPVALGTGGLAGRAVPAALVEWAGAPQGPAPVPARADEFMVSAITAHPGVAIVASGPMANLAAAADLARTRDALGTLARSIRFIAIAGGDERTADLHFSEDVNAVRKVLSLSVPVYQCGPDRTWPTVQNRKRMWEARTPLTWALKDLVHTWTRGASSQSPGLAACVPLAFAATGRMSLFREVRLSVQDSGRLRVARGSGHFHRTGGAADSLQAWVCDRVADWRLPAARHLFAAVARGAALQATAPVAPPDDEALTGDAARAAYGFPDLADLSALARALLEPDAVPARVEVMEIVRIARAGLGNAADPEEVAHLDLAEGFSGRVERTGDWADDREAAPPSALRPARFGIGHAGALLLLALILALTAVRLGAARRRRRAEVSRFDRSGVVQGVKGRSVSADGRRRNGGTSSGHEDAPDTDRKAAHG